MDGQEKTCNICGFTKPLQLFRKYKKGIFGVQAKCAECAKKYERLYYPKIDKTKRRDNVRRRLNKIKEFVRNHKEKHGCKNCGNKDYRVIDFHHCKGAKEFEIAMAVARHCSIDKISKEIEKCECLCANCHRIETHENRKLGVVKLGITSALGAEEREFDSLHPDLAA